MQRERQHKTRGFEGASKPLFFCPWAGFTKFACGQKKPLCGAARKNADRTRTRYRILEEQTLPDGSIVVKPQKQYNKYDCAPYFQ